MKFREPLLSLEMLERTAAMRGSTWRFLSGLLRSRYLLGSLLFYFVLLLFASGVVLTKYLTNPQDMQSYTLINPPESTPHPPSTPPKPTMEKTTPSRDVTTAAASINAIKPAQRVVVLNAPTAFTHPPLHSFGETLGPSGKIKAMPDMNGIMKTTELNRLGKVRDFQRDWKRSGSGNTTKAEFTVFKARYQDGDWNCNPEDVENLMLQIRRWSRNNIKASVHPKILDIGTDDLFTIKPPFVYLTGHKDFHFLDKEIMNIRDYLLVGGCVWADSALAGRRSRFDMAFRREMKRVLPDREFEIIPDKHEIFNTFFDNISLPKGMNEYHEPAEMINIGGELAVLYTLNGYGHYWETRLNDKGTIEWNIIRTSKPGEKPVRWQHVHGPHLGNAWAGILYRNMNDDTTRSSFKFGINAVVHLLTRYQDKINALPIDLSAAMEDNKPRKREKTDEELVAEEEANLKKEQAQTIRRINTIRMQGPSPDNLLSETGRLPTINGRER